MATQQPRKVRKRLYNLPHHLARRQLSARISPELDQAENTRSTTLRNGDRVRIVRGEFAGQEGKIVDVDVKNRRVSIEGITLTKADQKQVPRWFNPSNLMITRFDFSDAKRAEKLEASEDQVERSRREAEAARKEAEEARKREEAEATEEEAEQA